MQWKSIEIHLPEPFLQKDATFAITHKFFIGADVHNVVIQAYTACAFD